MRVRSQLQKNNKYLEKKCMSTITERDEVNTNCNRLAADINSLEQKLKNAEKDIATWNNKFNVGIFDNLRNNLECLDLFP